MALALPPPGPRQVTPQCAPAGGDFDADGVADHEDNCAQIADGTLSDVDQDFVGDVCDNCPTVHNPGQADADADGLGDACEDLIE